MGSRSAAAGTLVLAFLLPIAPAGAQEQDDLEPRIRGVEPRVLAVTARTLDVEARIVDVAVTGAGSTEIPIGADLLFAFGSAELGAEAGSQLAGVVELVRSTMPTSVRIEGHTDAVGDDAANQVLSERRAQAVRAALEGQLAGITPDVTGFGESSPLAPEMLADGSDNPAGRQQNRRVTIILVP